MYARCRSRCHLEFCLRVDKDVAQCAREQGCLLCGKGRLHQSNYLRKLLGADCDPSRSSHRTRFSFCCAKCRRRTTPPSLRFFGRKRTFAPLILLLTAMRCNRRVRELCELLEVDRRTIARWRRWWTEEFEASPQWGTLRGLIGTLDGVDLPRGLLDQFGGLRPKPIRTLLGHLGTLTGGDNAM